MQVTKFQTFVNTYAKGKSLSLAEWFDRYFTLEELLLEQLEHKQIFRQTQFVTLKLDLPIKIVQYFVKHETVLPSEKEVFHSFLADF